LKNQLAQLKTINIGNQETEVTLQKLKPSNKDTKLSDAINAIENGESHKIWLSLASEGINNAQLILGVLYVKGLGVGKSMKDAANWIGLARQNGSMEVSEKAEEVWSEYELWKYE
jgi:TPR repeat protein